VAKPQYQTRFRALRLRLTVYPYYLPFITILKNTLQNVWKVYKTCVIFVETIKQTTMTTLINQTGSKAVNIKKNMTSFIAMYVEIYAGQQQVLQSKDFSTFKKAFKWAETKLN
jgi:hypothetical protein